MSAPFVLAFALAFAPASAFAVDKHTCKVLDKLLKATDKGLESAAAGKASRQPASGIATYAGQAQSMAAQFSPKDPLPQEVVAALAAMETAARSVFSIAEASPALLTQGRIVAHAMPKICPGTQVPDFSRHR
jgi:hypothetical protein